MKEQIHVTDYANQITAALSKGILLNTQADKFNTMVIGWGHIEGSGTNRLLSSTSVRAAS